MFSDSDNPHKIENKATTSTGFIKNIDIRLADNHLKVFLESKDCKVKEVKKVFHRHSVFDLEKATKLEYAFKLNGKPAFCQKERGFRVVRCFSCHRYNHISANCPNRSNCEDCGSEDHTFTSEGYRQSNCINCGGNTKVRLTHVPNTWRLYKEYRKIKCFNKMKIFSINCQSWKTAKSDFGEIVDNYTIDVLCLTETFESYKEPVSFRQWSKLSKPQKDGYGGLLYYIKIVIMVFFLERKQDLEDEDFEVLCAKVTVIKDNYFCYWLCHIFHQKRKKIKGLLKVLDNCKDYKHIILTGDLNSKSLEWITKKSTLVEQYLKNTCLTMDCCVSMMGYLLEEQVTVLLTYLLSVQKLFQKCFL